MYVFDFWIICIVHFLVICKATAQLLNYKKRQNNIFFLMSLFTSVSHFFWKIISFSVAFSGGLWFDVLHVEILSVIYNFEQIGLYTILNLLSRTRWQHPHFRGDPQSKELTQTPTVAPHTPAVVATGSHGHLTRSHGTGSTNQWRRWCREAHCHMSRMGKWHWCCSHPQSAIKYNL